MRLYCVTDRPVCQLEGQVGLFLDWDGSRIKHVGLLCRSTDTQDVRCIHLAWHCRLEETGSEGVSWWLNPGSAPERLVQVAAIGRKVLRSNGRNIPYAFSSPSECFDRLSGQYLLGPTRHGLTCASFVLAVFHTAGLQLVKYESWPTKRQEDIQFQSAIAQLLEQHGADSAHVTEVRKEIGTVRFRPDEVAGAVLETVPPPVEFSKSRENAEAIIHRISSA